MGWGTGESSCPGRLETDSCIISLICRKDDSECFLWICAWVLLSWVQVCQKIRDPSQGLESTGRVPELAEGNYNPQLISFSRLFRRLIVFSWSNFGSYKNSPFLLKLNDVSRGADGLFSFLFSSFFFWEVCSPNHSCRWLCPWKQMAGWILQALLYINEQQSFIFD